MIVKQERYVLATKSYPLEFLNENYDMVDSIQDANLRIANKEDAEDYLTTLDEPEEYQVLKVNITYEI